MRKIVICLIIVCVFSNCKRDKEEKPKNRFNNIVSDKVLLKGWKNFANDSIKINIPNSWNPKEVKNVLFYIPLNKNKADLYYVILKTSSKIISFENYLKESVKQVLEKNKEINYLITKINFKDNTNCYTIDLYTKEKGINYKTHTILYKKDEFIYDFSYKYLNEENTNIENYRIIYNASLSFNYKGNLIIDSKNFIFKSEEVIKYEDL